MSCSVITQIKRIIVKSQKQYKHGYNIIYVANMWEYASKNYNVHAWILRASASHSNPSELRVSI
jgi:hypothetical protein